MMIRISLPEMQAEISRLVDNALLTHADLPSDQVASKAIDAADPGFILQYCQHLAAAEVTRLVRAARSKAARAALKPQLALPGFEKLPRRIAGTDGHKVNLGDATIADLREYHKVLNRQHKNRQEADPRISEIEGLIKVVSLHAKKHRGITAAQATALEAEKAAKKKR